MSAEDRIGRRHKRLKDTPTKGRRLVKKLMRHAKLILDSFMENEDDA